VGGTRSTVASIRSLPMASARSLPMASAQPTDVAFPTCSCRCKHHMGRVAALGSAADFSPWGFVARCLAGSSTAALAASVCAALVARFILSSQGLRGVLGGPGAHGAPAQVRVARASGTPDAINFSWPAQSCIRARKVSLCERCTSMAIITTQDRSGSARARTRSHVAQRW
jgi:hypothetical protein